MMNWIAYAALGVAGWFFFLRKKDEGSAPPAQSPSSPSHEFSIGDCITVDLSTDTTHLAFAGTPLDIVRRNGGERLACGRVVNVAKTFSTDPRTNGNLALAVELAKPIPAVDLGTSFAGELRVVFVPQQGIVGTCATCP